MTDPLYIGSGNNVAAIDRRTGATIWKTPLRQTFFKAGHDFVTLLVDDATVYAHTWGRLYALDRRTGQLLWENALPGMGHGLASLALANGQAVNPAQAHLRLTADRNADTQH